MNRNGRVVDSKHVVLSVDLQNVTTVTTKSASTFVSAMTCDVSSGTVNSTQSVGQSVSVHAYRAFGLADVAEVSGYAGADPEMLTTRGVLLKPQM